MNLERVEHFCLQNFSQSGHSLHFIGKYDRLVKWQSVKQVDESFKFLVLRYGDCYLIKLDVVLLQAIQTQFPRINENLRRIFHEVQSILSGRLRESGTQHEDLFIDWRAFEHFYEI